MFSQQATVSSDFGPVFRALSGMYAILTKELTILEVTDTYLQARYTTREALHGNLLTDTFDGSSALLNMPPTQALEQSLQHVLFHKKVHHIPMFCFNQRMPSTLGGSLKECYWSVTNTPVLDEKGELLHILHEAHEITEKTKISGNHHSQDQFPLLANNVNAVSWEYDLVHNKMFWGSGLKEIFGYTPEEMGEGGESWDARVHPDDFETVQKSIERANASGSKIWTGEYRFRKADGTYIPVLDQGYIIYHSDGRPIRTLGSIIDLSENRKTESVLKDSDTRFRHLLEVLPHLAWLAEPSGRVLYFNKNWYSYTGMSTDQTEGWTAFIHPDDTVTLLMEWHNTLSTGEPYEIEYRLRNFHDKSYRWFLERGVPMFGNDGQLLFWIGTLTDIEEQKQAVDRMREKDLQLENILNNSPAHLCLMHGPEHVCQFVTPGAALLYGNRPFLHKPARTIWPELQHTNFLNILDNVYSSGNTYKVNEYKVQVDRKRNGQLSEAYLNLEYRPLMKNGSPEGILMSAIEVTELVQTKQKAEQLALALQQNKACL